MIYLQSACITVTKYYHKPKYLIIGYLAPWGAASFSQFKVMYLGFRLDGPKSMGLWFRV